MNKMALTGMITLSGVFATFPVYASDFVMRISHNAPPAHHIARAYERFEKDVEALTKGKVDVQLFGSEQLFKSDQNHAAVARGQIEAASVVSYLWGKTVPEIQVLTIPYLMTDIEKIRKFPGSAAALMLDSEIQDKGVYNIGWLLDAADGVFTSNGKALITPQDFEGVKIRGLSKMFDTGLSAMGAKPSAMPGSEVYQALQMGVIDAGVTSVSAAHARRFYEVQEFGVVTPLTAVYQTLIVNPNWWNGLPDDVKSSIKEASHKMEQSLIPEHVISDVDVKQLQADGLKVHVHTEAEVDAMRQKMQPAVIDEFVKSSDIGAEIVRLIQEL